MFEDLSGQKFLGLTVVDLAEERKGGRVQWNCKCDCGNMCLVTSKDLKRLRTKSCGCVVESLEKYGFQDLTGQKFHRLTVLSRAEDSKDGRTRWNCKCDCGQECSGRAQNLKNETWKSCGCLQKELRTTHNMSNKPEYFCWYDIIRRCTNKNCDGFKDYGERGITICERWLNSFENFFEDMGERPSDKHSIDRKDNDGNYCPENCHWATRIEQANNTRSNTILELNGERLTISQWANRIGVSKHLIHGRIKLGWSTEKILTTATNGSNKNITHGKSKTSEYSIWADMRRRCTNTNRRDFKELEICEQWDCFEQFLRDMGPRPSDSHVLFRINNLLGYSPENCRWGTKLEQANNRSNNHHLSHDGRTQTMSQWARETGIPVYVISDRVHDGWAVEDALTVPYNTSDEEDE